MKPYHPELVLGPEARSSARPRQVTTETADQFLALCDRARSGELVIEAISRGQGNGQWICQLWYEE